MAKYNWDTLGLTPTKPLHRLFISNFEVYQRAIDCIRQLLLETSGLVATRATLDPPVEQWRFYDHEGNFLITVLHELVDRVLGVLIQSNDDAA